MAEEQQEIALLDRVLMRFATAETDDVLEQQVRGLLCPLLLKFATPHKAVKAKLMEAITHINKVLGSRSAMQLPVSDLIKQYTNPEVSEAVKKFTRIYLPMGLARLPDDELAESLISLLHAIDTCPDPALVYRHAIPVLPLLLRNTKPEDALARLGCTNPERKQRLLEYVRDFLLLNSAALQPVQRQQQQPQGEASSAPPLPPPGLSRTRLNQLVDHRGAVFRRPTREDMLALKMALVDFVSQAKTFTGREAALALLTAAGDPTSEVADRAVVGLRRVNADLNDPETIRTVMQHFTLSRASPTQKALPVDERRSLMSTRVRAVMATRLVRSTAAPKVVPLCLACVFSCIYENNGDAKLRVLGLQLMERMLHFSPPQQVEPLCPLLLDRILKLVEDPSNALEVFGMAYHNLGLLARKSDAMRARIRGDIGLLRKLFQRCAASDGTLALHLQEALALMKECYIGVNGEDARRLVNLLLEHVVHRQPAVRTTAVRYAIDVFPPTHVPSRFVLLLATADTQQDVRTQAEEALALAPQKKQQRQQKEGEGSKGAQKDEQEEKEKSKEEEGEQGHEGTKAADMSDAGERLGRVSADEKETNAEAAGAKEAVGSSAPAREVSAEGDGFVAPKFAEMTALLANKFLDAATRKRRADGTRGPVAAQELPYHEAVVRNGILFAFRCLNVEATGTRDEEEYVARYGSTKGRLLRLRGTLLRAHVHTDTDQASGGRGDSAAQGATSGESAAANASRATSTQPAEGTEEAATATAATSSAAPQSGSTATPEPAISVGRDLVTQEEEHPVSQLFHMVNLARQVTSVDALHGTALSCLLELASALPDVVSPHMVPAIPRLFANLSAPQRVVSTAAARLLAVTAVFAESQRERTIQRCIASMAAAGNDVAGVAHAFGSSYAAAHALAAMPPHHFYTGEGARLLESFIDACRHMLSLSREEMRLAACHALAEVALAHIIPPSVCDFASLLTTLEPFCRPDKTVKKEKRGGGAMAEAAVVAVGNIAQSLAAMPAPDGDDEKEAASLDARALDIIYETAHYTVFEMNLSAGDALCAALAGRLSVRSHNYFRQEIVQPLLFATATTATTAKSGGEPEGAPGEGSTAATAEVVREPSEEALMKRLADGLDTILYTKATDRSAATRHAAGVWLVGLCKNCAHTTAVQERLPELQRRFFDLLSEGDMVVQEVASHGLELCYDLGTAATKQKLVESLTTALSSGHKSSSHKFAAGSEDKVFAENELGRTREGASLTTYKDISSLAADLNQPDLIYRFMSLANHNVLWNSRRGAAYGFGRIAKHTGVSLEGRLDAVLPKLFRYKYDPNATTRSAMSNIWNTLVTDPVKTVDAHFTDIVKELNAHLSDRQWRVRESCALALADVLRGRTWREVQPTFLTTWQLAFRVIDDVKESVRKAGSSLCQRMAKLTVTLCKKPDSGSQVLQVLLPFLMETGLLSPVKDVKAVSLSVIVDVSHEARTALKPHLPTLVPTLLEALSGLESPGLDYLGQRLSSEKGMEEKLDDLRMSASKTSPIAQCLDECARQVDSETLGELVPRLLKMSKQGIGASTKAGCARFISALVRTCRGELQPYARKILRSLLTAASTSKSAPVRRDFANAVGEVCRVASIDDVASLVKKAKKMYLGHESTEQMEASAIVCRAVARRATDVIQAHAASALPLAFYGKHDESKVVREVWEDVWNEATQGTDKAAIRTHMPEILGILQPRLTDRSWEIKRQASSALSTALAACRPSDVPDIEPLTTTALESLSGRTWDGKYKAVKALVDLLHMYEQQTQDKAAFRSIFDKGVHAVLREAKKRDKAYRLEVMPALGDLCTHLQSEEQVLAVVEVLCSVLRAFVSRTDEGERGEEDNGQETSGGTNNNNDSDDDDDEEDEETGGIAGGAVSSMGGPSAERARDAMSAKVRAKETHRVGALHVVSKLWQSGTPAEVALPVLSPVLTRALQRGTLKVRVAAVEAVTSAVKHLDNRPREDAASHVGEQSKPEVPSLPIAVLLTPSLSALASCDLKTVHSSLRYATAALCLEMKRDGGLLERLDQAKTAAQEAMAETGESPLLAPSKAFSILVEDHLRKDSAPSVRGALAEMDRLIAK